ncbi:uncharacterized protein LOC115080282 [Rhinatrema bivittatum]|uniref:uncharacterized protein LOC115080282 n=1 Tax=Rhinatrema bivittatum TaxID=194408 RepID=UPI0011297EBD|nr:uncharacterized protein LOC115080282 [Rhinatrema bivittatum]
MPQQDTTLALGILFPSEVAMQERGRDLFTFVTVASSHIMRALQRPRKSRPGKRKVNHRRFLQNQISRKYADIEAATQQLATSILSQEAGHAAPPEPFSCPAAAGAGPGPPPPQRPRASAGQPEAGTFLGVAEAFLAPEADPAAAAAAAGPAPIDPSACSSDEAGTVESLFDNIVGPESMAFPPYGDFWAGSQTSQEEPEQDRSADGFILYGENLTSSLFDPRAIDPPPLLDFLMPSAESQASADCRAARIPFRQTPPGTSRPSSGHHRHCLAIHSGRGASPRRLSSAVSCGPENGGEAAVLAGSQPCGQCGRQVTRRAAACCLAGRPGLSEPAGGGGGRRGSPWRSVPGSGTRSQAWKLSGGPGLSLHAGRGPLAGRREWTLDELLVKNPVPHADPILQSDSVVQSSGCVLSTANPLVPITLPLEGSD